MILALPAPSRAQTAQEAHKELDLAEKAESSAALKHLTSVARALAQSPALTAKERGELTTRFAEVLGERVRSPGALAQVLGPEHRKAVTRQILYGVYFEQWLVEAPARIWVTVGRQRGEDARVRSVKPRSD